jgi:hypothetical protein
MIQVERSLIRLHILSPQPSVMWPPMTNEEFISKCKALHGEKYDYSITHYRNPMTPVSINCPTHGAFVQLPRRHATGVGCPMCASTADRVSPSQRRVQEWRKEQDAKKKEVIALIKQWEDHEQQGGLTPTEYEKLCQNTVTYLFQPYLQGFRKQLTTTDGANRYDFICQIKGGHAFWDSLCIDFKTRSILFECKNYEECITADEIYTTERYLSATALRTVCFLISRKGPTERCLQAAQGVRRESGKLISLLSNKDVTEMIQLKLEGQDPTSHLDEKIWHFLTTLPR